MRILRPTFHCGAFHESGATMRATCLFVVAIVAGSGFADDDKRPTFKLDEVVPTGRIEIEILNIQLSKRAGCRLPDAREYGV